MPSEDATIDVFFAINSSGRLQWQTKYKPGVWMTKYIPEKDKEFLRNPDLPPEVKSVLYRQTVPLLEQEISFVSFIKL